MDILLVLIPCTRNTNLAQWPHVKNRSPFKFHRPKITITARALGDLRARITPKRRGHSRRRRRPALARAASNPPRAIAPIRGAGASAPQHRSAKVVAQQPGCHGMHECSEICASNRNAYFTWLAESVQKDRLSRRQGMVTRVRLRRRGGGGGDAPRRRGLRAGSSKGEAAADGRRSPRVCVVVGRCRRSRPIHPRNRCSNR